MSWRGAPRSEAQVRRPITSSAAAQHKPVRLDPSAKNTNTATPPPCGPTPRLQHRQIPITAAAQRCHIAVQAPRPVVHGTLSHPIRTAVEHDWLAPFGQRCLQKPCTRLWQDYPLQWRSPCWSQLQLRHGCGHTIARAKLWPPAETARRPMIFHTSNPPRFVSGFGGTIGLLHFADVPKRTLSPTHVAENARTSPRATAFVRKHSPSALGRCARPRIGEALGLLPCTGSL